MPKCGCARVILGRIGIRNLAFNVALDTAQQRIDGAIDDMVHDMIGRVIASAGAPLAFVGLEVDHSGPVRGIGYRIPFRYLRVCRQDEFSCRPWARRVATTMRSEAWWG